jgi:hypothetical protein
MHQKPQSSSGCTGEKRGCGFMFHHSHFDHSHGVQRRGGFVAD